LSIIGTVPRDTCWQLALHPHFLLETTEATKMTASVGVENVDRSVHEIEELFMCRGSQTFTHSSLWLCGWNKIDLPALANKETKTFS